jgi:hypothetical protein
MWQVLFDDRVQTIFSHVRTAVTPNNFGRKIQILRDQLRTRPNEPNRTERPTNKGIQVVREHMTIPKERVCGKASS